ncbi:MAG: NAD(P)-dependent oxidoreductase [Cyclobacteriaceae bacterium]
MRILITGANGFLGSHLVERALKKGHEVFAALRVGADQSNLDHLTAYEVVDIDYTSVETIEATFKDTPPFDLIIHNAGLTKSYTMERYIQVNVTLTKNLLQVIQNKGLLNENGIFAYISSLASIGPLGHEGPASNYGRSKVLAEQAIIASGVNYMIYRPTGIYGERDLQFVPLIKSVKLGIYPLMTSAEHKMTLINAKDVAENVIECSLKHKNEIVHLEDGEIYLHKDLKETLETLLEKKSGNLSVPKFLVKSLLFCSDVIDRTLNRTPKLSLEHYSEISQDWDYDFSDERKRIPLSIEYTLQEGFQEAINFYVKNELI